MKKSVNRYLIAAAAIVFALNACSPNSDIYQKDNGKAAKQCEVSKFEYLVGQSQTKIDEAGFPKTARFIEPDAMVTRDFKAERLNVDVDENGIITRLWCG